MAAERRKAESFSSLRGRAREAAQFGEGIYIDLFEDQRLARWWERVGALVGARWRAGGSAL